MLLGLMLGAGAGTASAAGTAGTLDATFGSGGIVVTNLGLLRAVGAGLRRAREGQARIAMADRRRAQEAGRQLHPGRPVERLCRPGRQPAHRPAEFQRRRDGPADHRDPGAVMKLGIMGAGHVGGNIARRAALAGYDVTVRFARDQADLDALAAQIGGTAGEPSQAATAAAVTGSARVPSSRRAASPPQRWPRPGPHTSGTSRRPDSRARLEGRAS
jgi:NADP oxidoreductase coenzyme F420-dependent